MSISTDRLSQILWPRVQRRLEGNETSTLKGIMFHEELIALQRDELNQRIKALEL